MSRFVEIDGEGCVWHVRYWEVATLCQHLAGSNRGMTCVSVRLDGETEFNFWSPEEAEEIIASINAAERTHQKEEADHE